MASLRCGILALLWLLPAALAAAAGDAPPTRLQTLNQDLSGPPVNLLGTIADRWQDGSDTCFVLQVAGGAAPASQDGKLLACNPGPFDAARYGVGQPLRVTGALGAAMPRLVGGYVVNFPVVAAAFLYPVPPPGYYPGYYDYGSWYPGPWPGYSYYPYAAPFNWGAWYGQGGWNRSGWGVWMGR